MWARLRYGTRALVVFVGVALVVALVPSASWGAGSEVTRGSSRSVSWSVSASPRVVMSGSCSLPSSPASPSAGSSFTDSDGHTCMQGPVYASDGGQLVTLNGEDTTWIGLALILIVALQAAALVSLWGRDG